MALIMQLKKLGNPTRCLMLALLLEQLLAGLMGVLGGPVPTENRVLNKTLSFCTKPKIPLMKGCGNTFSSNNMVYARLYANGEAKVWPPFHYLKDEGVMQLQDHLSNVTHEIDCNVGDNGIRTETTNYQVTACPRQDGPPGAAAPLQGSLPCLLLIIALMIIR